MKTPALKLEAKYACGFWPFAILAQADHVGMNKAGQHRCCYHGRNKSKCVDLDKHDLLLIPEEANNTVQVHP